MKRKKGKTENKVSYGTISLPTPLIEKVKEKIKGTGMNSVSAYVAYVLRQVLSAPSEELFSNEEAKKVKKKLESLGY